MDIQKEREVFENRLKKMGKTDNETFSKNEDDSYKMDIIHFGWKIWQAAQEVPEGFVLVGCEKLAMIFETATNALIYQEASPKHDALSIIQGIARKSMIKAQEPK